MLIPQPSRHTPLDDGFRLTPSTAVYAPGEPEVAALVRELLAAAALPLPGASVSGPGQLAFLLADAPELGEEGYRLSVTSAGITATAQTPAGLRWAVHTLRQLLPPQIYSPGPVAGIDWVVLGADIADVPKYPWRGAMLDVGRWYKPVEWLYTFVDLAAMHRLNTVHLHLTDDQGWRFEVKRYPKLTSVGAWRTESPAGHGRDNVGDGVPHGGFYTQDQLRDLVAYAGRRGVRIVPEIDLPGHTQAAIAAYPELGNDPSSPPQVWTGFGISRRVLNVEDSTVQFIRHVLDELIDVFPGEYVHLGGDEVPPDEWRASPLAARRLAELGTDDPSALLGWWIGRLTEHLEARGRTVVVWDELAGQAPKTCLLMAWRDRQRVIDALAAGHDVIATPHTDTYLNYPETMDSSEPLSIASTEPNFGATPLSAVYAYEPDPGIVVETGARVIGTQGNLWTEYAPTPRRAEYDLMPRLAAIAEVAWGSDRDEHRFRAALTEHFRRLDAAGITYRPLPGELSPRPGKMSG
jgi:hexosaminidase